MKILNKMLQRGRQLELLKGLKVGEGEHAEVVVHLFFSDDILVFF